MSGGANVAGAKGALREEYRRKRAALPPERRREAEEAARAKVAALLDSRPEIRTVAAYWPVRDEFDVRGIIAMCRGRGLTVVLPRWNGAAGYGWAVMGPADGLAAGPRWIPEPGADAPAAAPGEIDLFLVPGLAFDAAGGRIGYGGGWFDRLLAGARADAEVVGMCYPEQISPEPLPQGPLDRPAPPCLDFTGA